MRLLKKICSKLYFKQWSVGVAEQRIEDIIRNKTADIQFTWLNSNSIMQSFADPCAFMDENGSVVLLAEDFTTGKLDGKIARITYNKETGFSTPTTVLNAGSHFSYPMLYEEDSKTYMLAENALDGGLHAYEYDKKNHTLTDKKKVSDLPLVDATVLKKDGKYWLFASILGKGVFNELHIFYADSFLGPYTPHAQNPVKKGHNGSRPAGGFIVVDGSIYRPAQNGAYYYGESITIQRVKKLTTAEYQEEVYMQIRADKNSKFNLGIHTINAAGNYIVTDGQRGHFQPLLQLARYISKFLFRNKNKIGLSTCYINNLLADLCNFEELLLLA
jgi:hypothetical protein